MPIGPYRLNGVTAHNRTTYELKGRRRQRLVGRLVNVAHDVRLTFATRARTKASDFFQRDVALASVIPLDSEFIPNGLDVNWTHVAGRLCSWNREESTSNKKRCPGRRHR